MRIAKRCLRGELVRRQAMTQDGAAMGRLGPSGERWLQGHLLLVTGCGSTLRG
jgi:hypothetical protein